MFGRKICNRLATHSAEMCLKQEGIKIQNIVE